jgi:HSP20 family protein
MANYPGKGYTMNIATNIAPQQQQTVPVQLHQTADRLVLATPMPGLEAEDILITIRGDHLTMCGEYRGSRHDQPEILLSEWTIGPYYREVVLPQPVDGELTNATYGNGVLVLSMPKALSGRQENNAEFRLQALKDTRGQHVGHTGRDIQPATGQRRRARQSQRTHRTKQP